MASSAPTATLCQLARQGWPLLVAALLTLLLGWSALHEGRGGGHAANAGWQAHLHDIEQVAPLPAPSGDECPHHAAPPRNLRWMVKAVRPAPAPPRRVLRWWPTSRCGTPMPCVGSCTTPRCA